MLFSIEADAGFIVKGYSVPDAYDAYCNLVLKSGGKTVAVVPANGTREFPLIGGRHLNSHCGFCFDESEIAGLSQMTDLEVRDENTGVLIYRRRRPEHVHAKVLRLETHLFPLWRIDSAMNSKFQYWAPGIERFGRETLLQMLTLGFHEFFIFVGSCFVQNRTTVRGRSVPRHLHDASSLRGIGGAADRVAPV